jgi:hypothetical protein
VGGKLQLRKNAVHYNFWEKISQLVDLAQPLDQLHPVDGPGPREKPGQKISQQKYF